ncbi:MAG TPA: kelch repeat-containing protein [Chitinophagales bacterium]|nr:kelch repeat-containing protein [Chitinophagales bacterium]
MNRSSFTQHILHKIFIILILLFCVNKTYAQAGMWTWINGDTTLGATPHYGTQEVPSLLNYPSGAYEGCEWTDKQGNFWYFGGAVSYYGETSDLWKYDLLTNMWIWMKGPGVANDTGSYGIQGVSSSTNLPPSRIFGMASWTDTSGNLWMYGGYNNINNGGQDNTFNDLWTYNVVTNEWTWISGLEIPNQQPVYGVNGVPSSLNSPGGRSELGCNWIDAENNLWLFGGASPNGAKYGDLWRFSISTNEWTWMKGPDTTGSDGVFGIKGISNPANTPSGRYCYSHWKDSGGNLWLFGGWQTKPNGISTSFMNDLWTYNLALNEWTWMRGDSLAADSGYSAGECVSSSNNDPSSRMEARSCWQDNDGNFWMFGGFTVILPFPYGIWLNDMWVYNPSMNKWTLVWSDTTYNEHGNFGVKGVTSPCNDPVGRMGSVTWFDPSTNSVYLLGGYEYLYPGSGGTRAELWKYIIDTACAIYSCFGEGIIEPYHTIELTLSPNPTSSTITLSLDFLNDKEFELEIFNVLGEKVSFSKEQSSGRKFSKDISLQNLSNGIYFLQLKTDMISLSKKIVKQ